MKTKKSPKMLSAVLSVFLITALTLFLSLNTLAAGPEFKLMQSIKLPVSPSLINFAHTDDFKYFLCSTKADMLMADGITGKILWQVNFERDFANKKFANQYWNQYANVVLVFDEDTKKGIATKYFLDGKTGKLLWKSDLYVSDFGKYKLADGFRFYFDPQTNGVLLPTKENVDFVDVKTGKVIWSKKFDLTGKAKEFDCAIMKYYDLVKINTSKESAIYLTTIDGKEVSDIEPYFNKKKFLADRKFATVLNVPEKNMYVIMQGETSSFFAFFGGMNVPSWKMNFIAYEEGSNKELWRKQYTIAYTFDWINNTPFVKMFYQDGKIFIEHDPALKANDGLTVLDIDSGQKLWECFFSTSDTKTQGLNKVLLTPFPAPDPLVVDGKAYVVDKVKNQLFCYNADNGTKIWETEKFPDAQQIPTLLKIDNILIMGYGGAAIKCAKITTTSNNVTYTTYRHEYNSKDKYGINAYDASSGKIVWSSETIAKKIKDKFSYIAGIEYVNGKLYCATDKNFFILDPKTGDVSNSIPVSKEKLGASWKLYYFPKQNEIILNCQSGIVKIDPNTATIKGTLKTPNVSYYPASNDMNADDFYSDYAIFTSGDPVKGVFKTFASIDLQNMTIRGIESASLLSSSASHFSEGGEMFYKANGSTLMIYKVK